MSVIAFSSRIGPVPLNVVLRESHSTSIEITKNPIETGAEVNDHAYVMPKRVTFDVGDKNAAATFAALVRFQETRIPFTLVTGLSVYRNMLVLSIDADRDKDSSRVLRGKVVLQEVIIVGTSYVGGTGGEQPDIDDGASDGRRGSAGDTATRAARPSPETARDAETRLRAGGTVTRGDAPVRPVPSGDNESLLRRVF